MIKFYGDMGAAQGISTLSDMVDALDFWQDNTIVNPGDIARSSTNSMIYAVAQTKGSTGTVEPVWGNTAGVTLTDNAVTWLVKDIRIADGAAKADKLTTASKINGIPFDGSQDITLPTDTIDGGSYIGSGLKVSSFDGLNVNISSGRAKIAGNGISFSGGQLALNPRKASLMYLDSAGTLGKVDCANPLDFVDDNTVGMWIFNQTVAGANVPNSAVGKSAIAVANDLIPHGGITSVDGWADTALQLDGSTGYFTSSNYTNIPLGATEREINLGFVLNAAPSGNAYLLNIGTSSGGNLLQIYTDTSKEIKIANGTTGYSTSFVLDIGKPSLFTFGYDGACAYVKINGSLVNKTAVSLTTVASNLYIGEYIAGGAYYAPITLHFMEIRNKMRSDVKTSEFSNKLVMPCFYDKTAAAYPTIPAAYAAACHEYRFDETSGTAAADSNTSAALNGTATGTTVVDSDLGLGKARKFNGTASDYLSLGNFAMGPQFTYIGVVNLSSFSNYAILWQNYNGSQSSRNVLYIDKNTGKLNFTIGGTGFPLHDDVIPLNTNVFIAVTINGTKATAYMCNSAPKITTIPTPLYISLPVDIGRDRNVGYFAGTYEYLAFGNYELTQAEIAQVYNALMFTGRRSILDDVIPANAISLGFVRTNGTKVIEKNDSWYKFGRREGATGGNRKVFLGWKYFSGGSCLKWDNPFGTGKYSKKIHWSQDAKGTNELTCISPFYSNTAYGVYPTTTRVGDNDAQNVTICALPTGVTNFNSIWQTSGYLGVYIECLEDYKGADAV